MVHTARKTDCRKHQSSESYLMCQFPRHLFVHVLYRVFIGTWHICPLSLKERERKQERMREIYRERKQGREGGREGEYVTETVCGLQKPKYYGYCRSIFQV